MNPLNDYLDQLQQAELLQLRGKLQTVASANSGALARVPSLKSLMQQHIALGLGTDFEILTNKWSHALAGVNIFLGKLDLASIDHPDITELPSYGQSLVMLFDLENVNFLTAQFDNKVRVHYKQVADTQERHKKEARALQAETERLERQRVQQEREATKAKEEAARALQFEAERPERERVQKEREAQNLRMRASVEMLSYDSMLERIEKKRRLEKTQTEQKSLKFRQEREALAESSRTELLAKEVEEKRVSQNKKIDGTGTSIGLCSIPVTAIWLWISSWSSSGIGDFLLTFFFGTPVLCTVVFFITKYAYVFARAK